MLIRGPHPRTARTVLLELQAGQSTRVLRSATTSARVARAQSSPPHSRVTPRTSPSDSGRRSADTAGDARSGGEHTRPAQSPRSLADKGLELFTKSFRSPHVRGVHLLVANIVCWRGGALPRVLADVACSAGCRRMLPCYQR